MDLLYRNSSNLLIVENLVDWYERDAAGKPTPVIADVIVSAQIFASDRETSLSGVITLEQEADQPQNYYRGVAPSTVDLDGHDEASVKYIIDGGGAYSYFERWQDCKVVDE